jgi:hypothetical protein
MRRSSRIAASRQVEPIVKCGRYYKECKCRTAATTEFMYLAEYFIVMIHKIPSGMTLESLVYICKKLNKLFSRILMLYKDDDVYEMTRNMVFFKFFKRPFMTQNIMNCVKMIIKQLPHDEYVDAPYQEKMSLETMDSYYQRLRQYSNIEDRDNIKNGTETSAEYVCLLLKYENIREMISNLIKGQLKITSWIPISCKVSSLIKEIKEIDPLEDVEIDLFGIITKETIASSLTGLTKKVINGEEQLGHYIYPSKVLAPREFSLMNARMHRLEDEYGIAKKWCDYYKHTVPEVAKLAADKYIGEECPICMEKIEEAKLLCCGHFYCAECFKRIPKCAVCRISIRK